MKTMDLMLVTKEGRKLHIDFNKVLAIGFVEEIRPRLWNISVSLRNLV